jgi:hypothetical protein
MFFRYSAFHQVLCTGKIPFPLPPDYTAQFPPYPAVKFLEDALYFSKAEIVDPAPKQRIQVFQYELSDVSPSPHSENLPKFVFEPFHRNGIGSQARFEMKRNRIT